MLKNKKKKKNQSQSQKEMVKNFKLSAIKVAHLPL